MSDKPAKRTTVYLPAELYRAVRLKAAQTRRSLSGVISDAVRQALQEEEVAFPEGRVTDKVISYAALLKDLKAHGKI